MVARLKLVDVVIGSRFLVQASARESFDFTNFRVGQVKTPEKPLELGDFDGHFL